MSEVPNVLMRRPFRSARSFTALRQKKTCAGYGYVAIIRTPNRSRSLLTIGVSASTTLRVCSTVGLSPARSAASRIGTSPARYVSGAPPMSTCPWRVMRMISVPVMFISAHVAPLTSIRPPLRWGMISL